jgi:hypothetical protein
MTSRTGANEANDKMQRTALRWCYRAPLMLMLGPDARGKNDVPKAKRNAEREHRIVTNVIADARDFVAGKAGRQAAVRTLVDGQ